LLAIVDSPILGYGSWGQGTEKYAQMYYNSVIDDLTAADPEMQMNRGGNFTAHSQVIQAWMEGGLLAGAFFLTYIWLLVRALLRCVRVRPVDFLMPAMVFVIASNLWDSIMSPFLGLSRISLAMAIAAIIVVDTERRVATDLAGPVNGGNASSRPINLMR
jgi:O-antigen ligase